MNKRIVLYLCKYHIHPNQVIVHHISPTKRGCCFIKNTTETKVKTLYTERHISNANALINRPNSFTIRFKDKNHMYVLREPNSFQTMRLKSRLEIPLDERKTIPPTERQRTRAMVLHPYIYILLLYRETEPSNIFGMEETRRYNTHSGMGFVKSIISQKLYRHQLSYLYSFTIRESVV